MSPVQSPQPAQVDAVKARRSLRNGFITLLLGIALAVGLLLAVPGLAGVAKSLSHMKPEWVVVAVLLEVLSCASYVVAFLRVFERAPLRVGARIALSEEAFGAAVSLGGVGSLAVGGWLMVERGAPAGRIAERSAVLFLYTSAINVITLILAGLGLFLGLPGPSNPLLSIVPAAVGAVVLVLFLLLPHVDVAAEANSGSGGLRQRCPPRCGVMRRQTLRIGAVLDTAECVLCLAAVATFLLASRAAAICRRTGSRSRRGAAISIDVRVAAGGLSVPAGPPRPHSGRPGTAY